MIPLRMLLLYVRSTKGLCRYEEEVAEGQQAVVGVLYIAKSRLGEKAPKRMTLTLEEDHASD